MCNMLHNYLYGPPRNARISQSTCSKKRRAEQSRLFFLHLVAHDNLFVTLLKSSLSAAPVDRFEFFSLQKPEPYNLRVKVR